MVRILVGLCCVFGLLDAAYARETVLALSFEDKALNGLPIYQDGKLLGYPGDLLPVELSRREEAGGEEAKIGVGSIIQGDFGVVDYDYHFAIQKQGDRLKFKAVNGYGSCFTPSVEVVSHPHVSIRRTTQGVYQVHVGKFQVRPGDRVSCRVTPVSLKITYQRTQVVTEPLGAKIRFGEEATNYVTPSVVRIPLELSVYSHGGNDPDEKANLAILLTKEGYVNQSVVVSEGERKIKVLLKKPDVD